MVNFSFNRKTTRQLIKASDKALGMTRYRYDWLTENKNSICGCIYEAWFGSDCVFIVVKHRNEYKLVCSRPNHLSIYLIEDIEEFLQYICIDELICKDMGEMSDAIEEVKTLPSTGLVTIQGDKIFLYDFIQR